MLERVKDFFRNLYSALYGTFVTDARHRYELEEETESL